MPLEERAHRIRINTINQIYWAGSGHPGASLGCVDILTHLYSILQPEDQFILSKGHAAPAWYATLAEFDYIQPEELKTFRQLNSRLQGHPHTILPQTITPTGSLGQGAAVSVGIAMGLKQANRSGVVYCLLGDGELQEGIVWEAANCAAHYGLNNLTWIIDANGWQSDGPTWGESFDIGSKFQSFGWWADMCSGHDFQYMEALFQTFSNCALDKPRAAIMLTTKGMGVSFMKSNPAFFGSMKLSDEDYNRAMAELMPHAGCSIEIMPNTGPQDDGSVIVKHATLGGKGIVGKLNG